MQLDEAFFLTLVHLWQAADSPAEKWTLQLTAAMRRVSVGHRSRRRRDLHPLTRPVSLVQPMQALETFFSLFLVGNGAGGVLELRRAGDAPRVAMVTEGRRIKMQLSCERGVKRFKEGKIRDCERSRAKALIPFHLHQSEARRRSDAETSPTSHRRGATFGRRQTQLDDDSSLPSLAANASRKELQRSAQGTQAPTRGALRRLAEGTPLPRARNSSAYARGDRRPKGMTHGVAQGAQSVNRKPPPR